MSHTLIHYPCKPVDISKNTGRWIYTTCQEIDCKAQFLAAITPVHRHTLHYRHLADALIQSYNPKLTVIYRGVGRDGERCSLKR
uniref:Uncharacterized protein n=1 Tax=Anguilla anguilla TaxID=7936 RepID=A0A0E9Y172_ANGAN